MCHVFAKNIQDIHPNGPFYHFCEFCAQISISISGVKLAFTLCCMTLFMCFSHMIFLATLLTVASH